MGDRTWAKFTIRECDRNTFQSVSECSTSDITSHSKRFITYILNEVNYGDPDLLDEVCIENHIPYDMWHGAGGSSLRFNNEGVSIQTRYSVDSQDIDLTTALSVLRALTLSDKEKVEELLQYAEQKEAQQVPMDWHTQKYNVSIAKAKHLIGAK